MKTFKKKWNYVSIEDAGCVVSKQAKCFYTAFKNMLKRELTNKGYNLVNFTLGHYYVSGFLEKNGEFIYVYYDIPRYGEKIKFSEHSYSTGVLYRRAKDAKDFRGEQNHFCSLEELPDSILSFR